MKRREFISLMKSSTASLIVAPWILSSCHTEEDMIGEPNWVINGGFDRPLTKLPAISADSMQLTAQGTSAEMLKGAVTSILSYGNESLGPTIVSRSGGSVAVDFKNGLSAKTNIHWHGLILPEEMDGHPNHVALPGNSINYVLPIRQRAGTYWYHPHPHGDTARQVFMGLAGMFIVSDEEELSLNLPSGEFEVPLIIQDKRFSSSTLDYSPSAMEVMSGYLGEQIIVNGLHAPFLDVEKGWYRLRVLNGSTARLYNLEFSNGMPFHIIGADGGLLASPEMVTSLFLGPGERVDILVDFSSLAIGQEVFLLSNKFSKYNVQGRQQFNIMKINVVRNASRQFSLPSHLSTITTIPTSAAVKTRDFDISAMMDGGHSINGKMFEEQRVDETVDAGSTEIWVFDNSAGDEIHPMHIHGVQFQVLERIGGRNSLAPAEKGWKDTVLVMPGEKVRVIMTFSEYTGVFVFHCHNLEHEDDGMMLNYRIQ